ncbi:hypothetical protein HYU11_02200 [Candidatus Woesearchaeota archaeon]|nr:hypothetical protein [Candidatus Woesearchaeota archaeon]
MAMVSTLEHKLYEAETKEDIGENISEGMGEGIQQILGPIAYLGGAALVTYVAGSIIGDSVPALINYATARVFENNVIAQLGNASIAIPRGYGLVDSVATVLGRDPSTVSSGMIASAPVGATFVGYVLSRLAGPALERLGNKAG